MSSNRQISAIGKWGNKIAPIFFCQCIGWFKTILDFEIRQHGQDRYTTGWASTSFYKNQKNITNICSCNSYCVNHIIEFVVLSVQFDEVSKQSENIYSFWIWCLQLEKKYMKFACVLFEHEAVEYNGLMFYNSLFNILLQVTGLCPILADTTIDLTVLGDYCWTQPK